MSWKSFVSAGLLCVLASPLFAQPVADIVPGGSFASGRLNAAGDWVWRVEIDTSNPIPSGSSPLDAELGFKETGSVLLDANSLSSGAGVNFDTVVPGTPIWGWENPGTGTNGFPEGLQSNCAGGLCTENTPGDDPNSIFAALGSQVYSTPTSNIPFIEIISQGPSTTGSLSSSISMSGVYGVGSNKGRIAEWAPSPPPDSINHDTYTGTFGFTAKAGDANLDNSVDLAIDYNIVLANLGGVNTPWYLGDFNNDNSIDLAIDYNIILANLGSGSGGGSGNVGAIPEPASVALVALGALMVTGLRFRKR
jgi:hypothetical protein